MNLSDYLHEECIQCNVQATDKLSVLKTIARLAKNSQVLQNISEDDIFQGLKAREELGSTGVGDAIAIPHCAMDDIQDFVVGIVTIPNGVDFEALDGNKTRLFVYIVAPKEKKNEHIRVLSNVSRILRFPENVREIVKGQDPEGVRSSFLQHTKLKQEEPERTQNYKQFTVVVQHEEVFHDLLSVFTEVPGCFVSVLEGNNAGRYLYSLPLFAHFWNEEQAGFNRIILAAVDASLSNEAIRRVNMILDDLEDPSGILLFSQDISYLAGTLNL